MKTTPAIALFALVVAFAARSAPAAEPPLTAVRELDRAVIHKAMQTGGALLENSLYKVQIGRRVVPGPVVEIHVHDTDIFHILEGSATFVTGGTAVDPKPSGPGEMQAKSITGGTEHHLAKGDIIVIPHGIPHRFTKIEQGPLVYFVVKVVQ